MAQGAGTRRGGPVGRSDGYEYLCSAIVKGELLPGERLLEEGLSARLGIGRAAVRTALIRLEHDGLVERERNRGARVRRVSEHEAVEILEARAALEGLAARHAAINADDDAIAAHDPEGAEAAMRCHLSRVAAALRAHHDGEPPPSAPSTKKSPRRRARRAVSDR